MTVRHAIFDLDGTLVDSLPGIAWSVNAALTGCGLRGLSQDLAPFIGPPIRSILASVCGATDGELLDRLELGFRISYDSHGWRRTAERPGVTQMLRELVDGGLRLWLVTNKPAAVTAKILARLNLDSFFCECACRDSRTPVFASKAEVLADLMERRGLQRAACLMIGDTPEDWDAAQTAGIPCVVVSKGYGAHSLRPQCKLIYEWNELKNICFGGGFRTPQSLTEGQRYSHDRSRHF